MAFLAALVGAILLTRSLLGVPPTDSVSIDFNRDIRPILNKNCTSCHGGVKQAGDVSFIYREQALSNGKSGRPTVIPGKPGASELIARVKTHDQSLRMPLDAPPLKTEQIELLEKWIKEGAPWGDYWAFVAPTQQNLPTIQNEAWPRGPLDHFVLARLEEESLSPSPEADKTALLRRASFDLIGLPPTADELDAFLADESDDAYEKQIDRLLASPHYGERWASMWLDLARYSDSKGYEKDFGRTMWPYRDWVVEAFNANMPYDEFITKQLAGDLLPEARLEDRIATAFHRQTPANDEGGTDDEEFRLKAVMDRVAVTWGVLNGVTMNCVQCHSHPYDPIRHTEYYSSLAFFNTSHDADIGAVYPIAADWPNLGVPVNKADYPEASAIHRQIDALRTDISLDINTRVDRDESWTMVRFERAEASVLVANERLLADLEAAVDFFTGKIESTTDEYTRSVDLQTVSFIQPQVDQAKANIELARETQAVTDFRLEGDLAEPIGTIPPFSVYDLKASIDTALVTAFKIEVPPASLEDARHSPEQGFIADKIEAWVVDADGAERRIDFHTFLSDSASDLEFNFGRLIDGTPIAEAEAAETSVKRLAKSSGFISYPHLHTTRWIVGVPERPISVSSGSQIRFRIAHTTSSEPPFNATGMPRVRLSVSGDSSWTRFAHSREFEEKVSRLEKLERRIREIAVLPLPIMTEQPAYAQRETRLFERGNFLTKADSAIAPDIPAVFPDFPSDAPRNRLTLARWFFGPDQPLTARVAVNRYWEQLFGLGLVETLEDFGSVGSQPSHPAMLDWLALYFQEDLQWDMKALLRTITTSATYRQSAITSTSLQEKDPYNRLLARGPRQRLTAEMVRDQALTASGLLNRELGGAPVMPPQPDGVWMSVYNSDRWVDEAGPNRYRRALYTYHKRSSPYPSFLSFDASMRDVSLPRRVPTNTPLQALVTLNDPVYNEASEALALRMRTLPLGQGVSDELAERLSYGARLVLTRSPTETELVVLRELYEDALKMETIGSAKEKYAMNAVSSALLNLDTALTR